MRRCEVNLPENQGGDGEENTESRGLLTFLVEASEHALMNTNYILGEVQPDYSKSHNNQDPPCVS